jgi:alanine dehydrogenase
VIEDDQGHAPVLTCMSEIAGALALIVGSGLLLSEFGGKGILIGGAPGVPPAELVILGAGVLGRSAARAAVAAAANVTLLDVSVERLRQAVLETRHPVITMLATRPNIEKALGFADLVLGAAAVRGERAPLLVTRDMLRFMKPRSFVMDLSIDMGGCFETSRPTAFPDATYEVDGILHFCVPNLPSAAARSSTQALTSALLPYLLDLGAQGLEHALEDSPDLRRGTYLFRGRCVKQSLAETFGLRWEPLAASRESA